MLFPCGKNNESLFWNCHTTVLACGDWLAAWFYQHDAGNLYGGAGTGRKLHERNAVDVSAQYCAHGNLAFKKHSWFIVMMITLSRVTLFTKDLFVYFCIRWCEGTSVSATSDSMNDPMRPLTIWMMPLVLVRSTWSTAQEAGGGQDGAHGSCRPLPSETWHPWERSVCSALS